MYHNASLNIYIKVYLMNTTQLWCHPVSKTDGFHRLELLEMKLFVLTVHVLNVRKYLPLSWSLVCDSECNRGRTFPLSWLWM